MLHGKALAIVVAYDIYRECCAGLMLEWKREPVDFHRFRERLAKQMLTYSPKNLKYAGDEKFRVHTQLPKFKRAKTCFSSSSASLSSSTLYTTDSGVNKMALEQADERLCGFLNRLLQHEKKMEKIDAKKNSHLLCVCCGKPTYWRCSQCPDKPPLHATPPEGRENSCFLHYHNASSLGLWRSDWYFKAGRKKRDWKYPDEMELRESDRQMRRLHGALTQPAATGASTTPRPGDITSRDAHGNAMSGIV